MPQFEGVFVVEIAARLDAAPVAGGMSGHGEGFPRHIFENKIVLVATVSYAKHLVMLI